jgi:hypothetical protein
MGTSLVVAVVFLIACGSETKPGAPAPVAPPPAGSAAPPATPPPATADAADPCPAIRARFAAALAARTDACKTDGDCACYNPVGGDDEGCGGVTDAPTAKQLETIEAEFHAASCRFTHNCAAWQCAPKCKAGRCGR